MMTSVMPMATVLDVADVNDARSYYHYSDMSKYARGYNDLPSHCYCAVL
jgi:hypothetical protein